MMNIPDLGIYSPERAFSILLLQLYKLVEKGKGDDAEADDLREQMGEYWNALSEDQRQRMRWLSEDLANLGNGGLGKGDPPDIQENGKGITVRA